MIGAVSIKNKSSVTKSPFLSQCYRLIGKEFFHNFLKQHILIRKIWYNAVLRGDSAKVEIGEGTNIQDRAVIVTSVELHCDYPREVSIGDNVTIGHGALLTSCTLGDHVLIGQGAIVQQGKTGGSILRVDVASSSVIMMRRTTKTWYLPSRKRRTINIVVKQLSTVRLFCKDSHTDNLCI